MAANDLRRVINKKVASSREISSNASGASASTLSSRFGMIHQARKENKPLGKVSFKAKGSKRSIVAGTAVAGNSAASRSGRASRGGRFNKFQKKKGPKHSQDSLDKDLDNYMMKDADFAKSKLDNDLDEYMKDVVTAE